jgi:GNAT superfamily N-acetyltransferase
MSTPFTIRPVRREDGPALVALQVELNAFVGDPTEHFTLATLQRDVFGAQPFVSALVAEQAGKVVAYVLHHDSYETAYAARGIYLADIYVTPAARRQGIARAMLAAVARSGVARGVSYLWWNSDAWNAEAHAAWRALGAIHEEVTAHAIFHAAFDRLIAS